MKIHNDFTLYWRVVPSGKRVVYYHAYDSSGNRLCGKSTGETTMTAARLMCNRLLKEGKLAPDKGRMPTFAEYAQGWWNWETCQYLKSRKKRVNLTQGYAEKSHRILERKLVPYFGKMRMDKITPDAIETWFDSLAKEKIKNTTINGYYATLLTMLKWAAKKKIIQSDPTTEIQKLVNDRKEIKIITRDEFKALFGGDLKQVWDNDRIVHTANKLAALTGMRIGEVLGLRGDYVFDDHIFLCAQYDIYGYRDTKTKDKHNIPLPSGMIAELRELMDFNGKGFLFSENGGARPVGHTRIYRGLHKALKNIGVDEAEVRARGLALHGWRHFFNTELLKGGLTVKQAQAVTGHKSERMTEWYCHFDPEDFGKAKEIQEGLLCSADPSEPDKQPDSADVKILKWPGQEEVPELKRA